MKKSDQVIPGNYIKQKQLTMLYIIKKVLSKLDASHKRSMFLLVKISGYQ